MKKSVKALSVILVLAALFGLVGGGISLKDTMDCKAYWEAKGEESDANLAMLEDGLNTLEENEAVYIEGRDAYAQGLKDYEAGKKDLADGEKEYNDGVKLLAEKQKEYDDGLALINVKQAEYNAGVAKLGEAAKLLEAGQKEYDAGAATLAQAKTLLDGLAELQGKYGEWKEGYNGLKGLQQSAAENKIPLGDPSPSNITDYYTAIDTLSNGVQKNLDMINNLSLPTAELNVKRNEDSVKKDNEDISKANQELQAAKDSGADENVIKDLEAKLVGLQEKLAKDEAALLKAKETFDVNVESKKICETKLANLNALKEGHAPDAVAQGQQQLAAGVAQAVQGMMGNPEIASKLPADLGPTVAALPTMDYPTFIAAMDQINATANGIVGAPGGVADQYKAGSAQLAEAKKELDAGYAEYKAGKAQLDDGAAQLAAGKAKLADGKRQLDEGKAQLAEAEKQLEDGKKQLAEAEKQLTEGKAKLDEFEAGRDQLIEGLETLKATETYAGLVSIADRLGPDFKYMKNDTDLDIEKGLEAVSVAREFSAENSAVVTKELTTRAVAAVLALLGSAVALVAGIMGLSAKVKGSGVLAVIAAVAAAAAVVAALAAGSEMSIVAGSTAAMLAVAAGAVVAVVAVVHAAAALSPAKAAA